MLVISIHSFMHSGYLVVNDNTATKQDSQSFHMEVEEPSSSPSNFSSRLMCFLWQGLRKLNIPIRPLSLKYCPT